MRSAQYCSLPLRLVHVRCGQAKGTGWCPSAEIGHGKVAGIHATAWLLHFIQKVQTGANVPRNPLPLVYPVRKKSSCRATVVSATVLPSRKMSTSGEKDQLLQLYGRTRKSSLLELYCRTKETRHEGMHIDLQSVENRGEIPPRLFLHADFALFSLIFSCAFPPFSGVSPLCLFSSLHYPWAVAAPSTTTIAIVQISLWGTVVLLFTVSLTCAERERDCSVNIQCKHHTKMPKWFICQSYIVQK